MERGHDCTAVLTREEGGGRGRVPCSAVERGGPRARVVWRGVEDNTPVVSMGGGSGDFPARVPLRTVQKIHHSAYQIRLSASKFTI